MCQFIHELMNYSVMRLKFLLHLRQIKFFVSMVIQKAIIMLKAKLLLKYEQGFFYEPPYIMTMFPWQRVDMSQTFCV